MANERGSSHCSSRLTCSFWIDSHRSVFCPPLIEKERGGIRTAFDLSFFWAVRLHAEPSGFLYGHCLSCHLCGCSGCWAPLWAMLELPAPRLLRLLGSFMGTALRLLRLLAISCLRRLPRAHPGRLPRAHPSTKKNVSGWLAQPGQPRHPSHRTHTTRPCSLRQPK